MGFVCWEVRWVDGVGGEVVIMLVALPSVIRSTMSNPTVCGVHIWYLVLVSSLSDLEVRQSRGKMEQLPGPTHSDCMAPFRTVSYGIRTVCQKRTASTHAAHAPCVL